MVIIDTVVNTLFGGLTLDPAGMHCPSWDDAFVSSFNMYCIVTVMRFVIILIKFYVCMHRSFVPRTPLC